MLLSVGLPLALAFIMFSLGVGLSPADFKRVAERPLAFLIGAVNQVILLPIITYTLILAFGITGEIAVGMMILSVCPGGVTSNVVSKLARADVALSVTLTAVISLLSAITVPIVLALSMDAFMGADAIEIDITKTAITMFALTVVPITLGLCARLFAPGIFETAEPTLVRIATILFILIVIAALASNWALFIREVTVLGPMLFLLVVILTTVGFVLPRLLGRSNKEAKTISIETGIQNGTLGIAVAAIIVGGAPGISAYAVPSAVYSILMYLILIPAVTIYRRID